ncbi:hypothetical protein GCM10022271_25760 [Corallibacter vietnamensis]|uniref:Cell wall anchor protein n=1 Tax=Corallibacter vietnamensis TaxID=904130 RepID=A0ABP7HJV4_9FLAO
MKFKKNYFFLVVVLFISTYGYSQVGIGTTSPDESALLDVSSTTQGLLAPRMSTAQRLAITDPAKGLLVFDNNESVFYFYDGTSWLPVKGAEKRDNYKLVKSVADLADELAVGGGSKYILNSDYMYEINGTILFDFPIDLNGAYIEGHDTGEDILVNNSGTALFSGTKGGRLKDVLINGNNQQVFDITGGPSENIIGYSVVITGASSLGVLSNLNVVFFSVLQVVNTSDGLDISDIKSFFVQNVFWTEANEGTFLDVSGEFDNFQMANGRVVTDINEIGIDVSLNPTINISGSLSEISFAGDGERIKGYTANTYSGYNFSTDWDVNCSGVPLEKDSNATGDINLNYPIGFGATTTFTGTGTASRLKLLGDTTSNNLFRFSRSGNNRIVYEGSKSRYFNISTSLSFRGSNNNAIFVFYLAKNGSVVEETRVYREIGSNNDIGAVAVIGTIELAPTDYIEVWAERYSGNGNLLTVSLNLIAK